MEISQRHLEEVPILELRGSLLAGAPCIELRQKIQDLAKSDPRVIIDLSQVDYIDSSGLGTLVASFTMLERAGGGLRILKPSERDMELLVLTKLASVFQVFDDEQAAVNSFFAGREAKKFDILSFVQEQRRKREEDED
ncbi:MAG: STAS domain-containing protein [Bryobacter sp.]